MTYFEKLKDPRWQKKRLEIFTRDSFTCRRCEDSKKTLHCHHLYYVSKRDPWAYPSGAYLTLCVDCHEADSSGDTDWQRSGMSSAWEAGLCGFLEVLGENGFYDLASDVHFASELSGRSWADILGEISRSLISRGKERFSDWSI